MNTFEKIENAISTATVNGNFNSDLIADKDLRKLAIQTYINKTANENPESVLREYMDVVDVSILEKKTQKAVNLDSSTIILGGKIALVIEKSDSYILGKFDQPTFEDKPYFTIAYHEDSYFGGQYDLDLETATANFIKRNQ